MYKKIHTKEFCILHDNQPDFHFCCSKKSEAVLDAIKNKYVINRIKSMKSEQSRNLSRSPECLNKILQKGG